jgi:tetratricopeptide (TPR) repeat protein
MSIEHDFLGPIPAAAVSPAPATSGGQSQPLAETAASRLERVPAGVRGVLTELMRAVESGTNRRIDLAVEKVSRLDPVSQCSADDELVALVQVMWLGVRETYEQPGEDQFASYTALMPLYTEILGQTAQRPVLRDMPKFLFTGGDAFALSWYDAADGRVLRTDDYYEFHAQRLKDFLASPGFRGWRGQERIADFLGAAVARWMIHLAHFIRNRRVKLFANLLDVALLLLKAMPALRPAFASLGHLLPAAKRGFLFLLDGSEDPVDKVLKRALAAADQAGKPDVREWLDLYTLGALPEVPKTEDSEESPELTVSFVFRSALEEVFGDGQITAEEEEVLHHLRTFLEIPQEKYQRIFEQVKEAHRLKRLPILDRDFCPRAFLARILQKTIEDGVITDEERGIIGKVANALLISQDVLASVFKEVKQGLTARGGAPSDTETEELQAVYGTIRYIALEERVRTVLVTDHGMKLTGKATKALAALRAEAGLATAAADPGRAGRFAVAGFLYEPQVYLYPVLVLYLESPDLDPLRLQFKGGHLNLTWKKHVDQLVGSETILPANEVFRLHNPVLDGPIEVQRVLIDENLAFFREGLSETKGKYTVTLAKASALAPALAVQMTGGIDLTGAFDHAQGLVADGLPEQALAALRVVHQAFPDLHRVAYLMGCCHAQLSRTKGNPNDEARHALEWFRRELELAPESDEAMRGLGIMQAGLDQWDEALQWFQRAHDLVPGHLLTLGCLVRTFQHRETRQGPREGAQAGGAVPDYVAKYVGDAWQTAPNHVVTRSLIDAFNRVCGRDLVRLFRVLPLQTQRQ